MLSQNSEDQTPLNPQPQDSELIKVRFGNIKDLAAIFSSIFLHALGYGIIMVMIALKLEEFVKNEVLISISSATQIIAGIIFARFLPSLGKKIGLINTLYLGSLLSATGAILFYFYSNFFLWILLIYTYGTGLFICGVTRQTIMMNLAPKHMRAVILSLGGMTVALANGLGPLLLQLINTQKSFYSFSIAASLFLLSMIPLYRLRKSVVDIHKEKKIGLARYIKNSPKIMFAAFTTNYVISTTSAFLIIYGLKIGMTQNQASMLISIFLFGSLFSLPLGRLVDILNRRFLMIACAALSLINIFLISISRDFHTIYILLFLTFGSLIGSKLSATVLINEKYKPTQRLAVNSAFARVALSGNIVGLFTTGIFMKFLGPSGLWTSSMFILSLFLAFCLKNYHYQLKTQKISFKDFSIFNKKSDDIIEI